MFDEMIHEIHTIDNNGVEVTRPEWVSGSKIRRKRTTDPNAQEGKSPYKFETETFISDFKGDHILNFSASKTFQEAFPTRASLMKDVKLIGTKAPSPFHKDKEDNPDSFYKSIKPAVQLAQIFAVLPVAGYGGRNYKSIKFRWIHWKTIYFFVVSCGLFIILLISIIHNLKNGISYDKSDGIAFYMNGVLANILLFELSKNWRKVNEHFAITELKLNKYNYPKGSSKQFKMVIFSFMTTALVEHLLSRMAEVQRTLPCARDESISSITEAFFVNYYYDIFSRTSYSHWKGIIIFVLHFLCTFTWNFNDLLLGLISWSIAKRFKQLNDSLFKVQGQNKDQFFWREVRKDYNELTELTRNVDFHIQKLMLLSIGDNLYFICIQILKGLKKSGNLYDSLYFLWSVGFLIMRTCFVAFTAAGINDESKEAKTVLFSVPERSYCAETRRFLTQLTVNEIALTGCRFFSITRGLILTIAGTVVTYEVILVQFNNEGSLSTAQNKTTCFQ